ncbi:Coiled-coil domain-containing protein [Schistosoma japonicum]|nr:Coiled-coil domain-containing protein [Schistosoma japonicum]
MKSTFNGWYNLIYNINILSTILQVKTEFHIKKSYFIYWKLQLHQIIVNRDIEKAKLQSIELVKKEYNAKQFYETSLVKRCFSNWQRNIQMQKTTRDQLERESLRHGKEIEFLNNLEIFLSNNEMKTFTGNDNNDETVQSGSCKCLNDKKPQKLKTTSSDQLNLKSMNSFGSLMDLKPDNFSVDHSKSNGKMNHKVLTQSNSMKSYLNQTILHQHNIITAQNQQIHELKTAHLYSEWLLEVRTRELTKKILQNTVTKNNEIDKTSESAEPLIRIGDDSNVHDHSLMTPNETNNSVKNNQSMTDSHSGSIHSKNLSIVRKNSFVQKMEERAAERARRHALQEERRRENEQKKKEQLAKQLEEEAYRIKQEKKMLIIAQKEKRIREEELRQQKELRLAHQHELNTKVTIHRNISCLRYYGFKPWMKYVTRQHELVEMMQNVFHTWLLVVQIKYEQEDKFVQHHYNLFLMKKIINAFRKACNVSKEKEVYAYTWYCQQLLCRSFTLWIQYITKLCIRQLQQGEIAVEHYKRHLLDVHFKVWTHFPCIQRNQREREYRREQFRKCLLDIIPDFNPPKYDDNETD